MARTNSLPQPPGCNSALSRSVKKSSISKHGGAATTTGHWVACFDAGTSRSAMHVSPFSVEVPAPLAPPRTPDPVGSGGGSSTRRAGRLDSSVGQREREFPVRPEFDDPAVVVDLRVVHRTHREQVVEIGAPTVSPPGEVVELAAVAERSGSSQARPDRERSAPWRTHRPNTCSNRTARPRRATALGPRPCVAASSDVDAHEGAHRPRSGAPCRYDPVSVRSPAAPSSKAAGRRPPNR